MNAPLKDEAERRLRELLEQLRTERDLLRVRTHLLTADMKQEWDDVELRFHAVETKLRNLRTNVLESAEDVAVAANLLIDEIANAYSRFRNALDRKTD